MSYDDDFVLGVVAQDDAENSTGIEKMAHDIFDDVLHNIIHDIVLQVHREEKMLRANSAAIEIEDIATNNPEGDISFTQTPSKSPGPAKSPKSPRGPRWRTEAARNINGEVHLTGNPLETQTRILCPKCHLPQWLELPLKQAPHDPNIKYCPRRPIVNIPGHDVHGVPFPVTDAKGNSRKRQKKDNFPSQLQEPTSSFESPGPPTPPDDTTTNITEKKKKPPKKESYPEVTCKRCNYKCAVNIYGRHLSKCMGIGGRASGRAAALKMNGEASGSRGTSTPPVSRKGTPLPPGAAAQKKSPSKRAASSFDEDDDEDDYEEKTPKKKRRKKPGPKKVKLEKMQLEKEKEVTPAVQSKLKLKFKKVEKEGSMEVKVKEEGGDGRAGNGVPAPLGPRDQSSESSHTLSSAL